MIYSKEIVNKLDLIPSEREAALFICEIGIERAYTLITKITRRIERRIKACWKANNHLPINNEWVRRTPLEVELLHRLKIGVTIVDQTNSCWAAHQRILARIAERNAKRSLRKNNNSCITISI